MYLIQPGSRVSLNVCQAGNPTSVENIAVDSAMKVRIDGNVITVAGVDGLVTIYNASGIKVAAANANGSVTFDASALAHGVYIVRAGKSAAKIVL